AEKTASFAICVTSENSNTKKAPQWRLQQSNQTNFYSTVIVNDLSTSVSPPAFVMSPCATPSADLFGSCLKITEKLPVPGFVVVKTKFTPIGFPLASFGAA